MKSRLFSMTTVIAVGAVITASAAGCRITAEFGLFSGRAEEDFSVSTPFEDVGTLTVEWSSDDVRVRFDESATEITASGVLTVRARDDDEAEEGLKEVDIMFVVAESSPSQVFLRINVSDDLDALVSADVEVVVPGGVGLRVENDDGEVVVEGNTGSTSIETTRGRVTVIEQAGDTEVETTSGRIGIESLGGSVEALSINGRIDITAEPGAGDSVIAETTNGRVTIFVPSDTAADLTLRSLVGEFDLDLRDFTVDDLDRRFNRVTATLNGGGGEITAETVGGRVVFGSL